MITILFRGQAGWNAVTAPFSPKSIKTILNRAKGKPGTVEVVHETTVKSLIRYGEFELATNGAADAGLTEADGTIDRFDTEEAGLAHIRSTQ